MNPVGLRRSKMLGVVKAAVRSAIELERAMTAAIQTVGNEALRNRLDDEAKRLFRATSYSLPEAWRIVANRHCRK